MSLFKNLALVLVTIGMGGCLPEYLKKYSKSSPKSEVKTDSLSVPTKRQAVYAIDKRTFRFKQDFGSVWNSALEVLLHNYNLNIVDKDSGVITTEWDTFYLKDAVFRNKVSIRVKKTSWKTVDVIVYNNVETLKPNRTALSNVWFPARNDNKEVRRLIQNMALVLNQDPPKTFSNLSSDQMPGPRKPKKFH